LRDATGNRRFLPVQVSGKSKLHPWDSNPYVVSQIWAEAREAYKSGEDLMLSEADTATAEIMHWREHPNKLRFPLYGVLQAFKIRKAGS